MLRLHHEKQCVHLYYDHMFVSFFYVQLLTLSSAEWVYFVNPSLTIHKDNTENFFIERPINDYIF